MVRNTVIISLTYHAVLATSRYFKPPFNCNGVKNYINFILTAVVCVQCTRICSECVSTGALHYSLPYMCLCPMEKKKLRTGVHV